jgi:DNA-binding XRE family transcriptional regulator
VHGKAATVEELQSHADFLVDLIYPGASSHGRALAAAMAKPRIKRGADGAHARELDRHVGARMRARRIMLGLTQQQLAERIGIAYQQAHKYEKGNRRPPVGVFRAPGCRSWTGRADMWHRLFALGCALVIGGCQASPPPASTEPITHKTVAHPGDAAVSAVGTPFYLVFKSVFCVASVAIAAPVAGIAALSEGRFASEVRRDLGDGVSQNCGPPYVLSPSRTVSANTGPEISAGPEASLRPPPSAAPEPPAVSTPEKHPAPPTGGPVQLVPGIHCGAACSIP